ncbi:barstar family protein [Streptomyces sp. NPDC052225]|uniref:barstar family protein n=1 Tax=Streptomyces sp. NPDC052225 TaxID=3154949 RepID=UPI003442DCA1
MSRMYEAVAGDGWAVRVVDLEGAADKGAFMDRFAAALQLPGWFGRNWDALADVLSDPGVWPKSATAGLVVVVTGWADFGGRRSVEWETAREVFEEAVERRRDGDTALVVLLGLR